MLKSFTERGVGEPEKVQIRARPKQLDPRSRPPYFLLCILIMYIICTFLERDLAAEVPNILRDIASILLGHVFLEHLRGALAF